MAPRSRLLARAGALRGSRADVALALFVVAIVGLLVVPVPPAVLDVLLATSLATAVVVLLVVLYVGDALAIATFPTLLLLTTLYRLSLNVSTSRMILLRGDAGEVIKAFGNFVVRGNYLVGAIVFGILTIIQFVVIAKGSERVAEVAARFTLDAMPGKQMAIDAELRAGSIDVAEARRRRRAIMRESSFYGAMDGAMKFVKGDVIAGLIITAVNILGGLAVGVLQRDMAAGDALKKYGLLTIGDGLVTQIPALVTSTAAGILVTRVASEEPDTPLGGELGSQLFGNAKALFAASAFVGLLAIVPGLPGPPFLVIAVGLVLLAQRRASQVARERRAETTPGAGVAPKPGKKAFVPIVVPWSVDLGPGFSAVIDDEGAEGQGLRARIVGLRDRLFHELGLPLPSPRVAIAPELPELAAVVSIREVPVELVSPPAEGGDVAAQADAVVTSAHRSLSRRAHELLGIGETQLLLDALEEVNPALVRQLVPKPLSVTLLADVLRRLLEEHVSIRDLRTILEGIAPIAATDKDPLNLAEAARASLRRALTHRLTRGARHLEVYVLDGTIEETVRGAITRTSAGAFLTLSPSATREIVRSVRDSIETSPPPPGDAPVILASPDVRRFVRKLVESDLPEAVVTSFAELEPELQLSPRARVLPR
ncbi:MAG: FHIPEP family type III secretion protein [Deltaproteobacteria bacterium]|nr:FHIPEP family type III secretion protein [Deltaproteobacteria bacterium]